MAYVCPSKRLKSLHGNLTRIENALAEIIDEKRPFITARERERLQHHTRSAVNKIKDWDLPNSLSIRRALAQVVEVDCVDDDRLLRVAKQQILDLEKLSKDLMGMPKFVRFAVFHRPRIKGIKDHVEKVISVGPVMGRPPKHVHKK